MTPDILTEALYYFFQPLQVNVSEWFHSGTAFITIQFWFVKSCLLVCYSVVLSIAKIIDHLNLCVLLQKSLLHPKTVN